MVVPDRKELAGVLSYYREKLLQTILQRITDYRNELISLKKSYAFRRPEDLIYQKTQRVDEILRHLNMATNHLLKIHQQNLFYRQQQLHHLNPLEILRRGYSICYKDGEVIKNVKQLNILDVVQVKLAKGQFLSQVQMLGEGQ